MISGAAISNNIQRFVDGESTLADFDKWLVEALWEAPKEDEILSLIHVAIAEYGAGYISELELKSDLEKLISRDVTQNKFIEVSPETHKFQLIPFVIPHLEIDSRIEFGEVGASSRVQIRRSVFQ